MRSRIIGMAALAAAAVVAAGCGGTSQQTANDVSQGPGHGADKGSLYRADNLSKALDALKGKLGDGKLTTLKIEASSLKSEITKDGKAQTLIINSKFKPTTVAIGAAVSSPFSADEVKPDVPEKIVSALASKGVTLKDVDYFLVSGIQGKTGWLIYTTSHGNFQANLDGSGAKKLGSSTTVTSKDADKQAKDAQNAADATAKSAQSLQDCLAKAGTDVAKVQKCTTGG